MNISFGLSMAVTLVGLALYLLSGAGKRQDLGRIMFAAGLLATLLKFAGTAALHIG